MSTHMRRGSTVVEWLVVIPIIGILVGLLLPAVMSAHERARQVECSNNLRQLAMAVHGFETSKRRFPGSQELVLPRDPASVAVPHIGYNKPASWLAMLLPELARGDIADRWQSTTLAFGHRSLVPGLSFARCPSASQVALHGVMRAEPTVPAPTIRLPAAPQPRVQQPGGALGKTQQVGI